MLIRIFFKSIFQTLKDFYQSKRLFLLGGVFLVLLFFGAILATFYYLFNYLIVYLPGGYVFAPKMLGIIILAVFLFTMLLTFIASGPTFFNQKELKLLVPLPLAQKELFLYAFYKLLYFSFYGSLFILLPVFVAYGLALHFSFSYYLLVLFAIFFITFVASSFGVILFFVLDFLVFRLNFKLRKILFILFLFSILSGIIYLFLNFDTNKLDFNFVENLVFNFKFNNLYLPWNWFTNLFYHYQQNNLNLLFAYGALILFFSLFIYFSLEKFASKYFLKALEYYENLSVAKKTKKFNFKTIFSQNKFVNLFLKDVLIHIRDVNYWIQIFIFVFLMLVYVAVIQGNKVADNPYIVSILTLGGIASVSFFVSAISLRFIFPNTSLEGRSFWVLKTMPVKTWKLLIIKILFFSSIICLISSLLLWYYFKTFAIKALIALPLMILNFFVAIFISVLYFLLGCLMPSFKETNPSKIATSYSGLLSIFLSNLAVFVIILTIFPFLLHYYLNLYNCLSEGYKNFLIIVFTWIFVLIFVSGWMLKLASRKFENLEI